MSGRTRGRDAASGRTQGRDAAGTGAGGAGGPGPVKRLAVGALVGLLLTAALTAVLALGDAAAGLPFVPFDLFDFAARVLPGPVVTLGIETLIGTLTALGFDLRETAKLAEQLAAVGGLVLFGVLAGAVFHASRQRHPVRGGLVFGLLVGVLAAWVSATLAPAGASTLAAVWEVAVFAGWGALLGWSRARLFGVSAPPRPGEGAARTRVGESTRAAGTASATDAATDADAEARTLDRRRFLLRLGGATATVTVAGAGLARALSRDGGPAGGAEPRVALPDRGDLLQPAPGTRPEYTPVADHYRIDINTRPPEVDGDRWRLALDGLVARPTELGLAELKAYPALHQFVTLSCISNPIAGPLIGTTRWTGVPLRRVLEDVQPREGARFARIHAVDGFHETVDLEDVRRDKRIMLTWAWDGAPLTAGHGFPLRVYLPNRYGMKQPKWIERIELTDRFVPGYWVERGWDREAIMKATSVIDTVAVDHAFDRGEHRLVPVGGIAHAGDRGISAVEVQVDDGPWEQARLRTPLSEKTWVVWRWDWPFEPGRHRLTVRCVDGEGRRQIVERSEPHPAGATGLHSVDARVTGMSEV